MEVGVEGRGEVSAPTKLIISILGCVATGSTWGQYLSRDATVLSACEFGVGFHSDFRLVKTGRFGFFGRTNTDGVLEHKPDNR